MRVMLVALFGAICAACTALPQGAGNAVNTFVLEMSPQSADVARRAGGPHLTVVPVSAVAPYDTRAMLYRDRAQEIKRFTKNEWAAKPADMLGQILLDALAASAAFASVSTEPSSAQPRYAVRVRLLTLHQDFTRAPSEAVLVLRAEVASVPGRGTITTRTFRVVESAASDDPYGGVGAANRAVREALVQIVAFVATAVADPARPVSSPAAARPTPGAS